MLLVKPGWMVVTTDARALVPVLRNARNRKVNCHNSFILQQASCLKKSHLHVEVTDHESFIMVDAPSTLIYPPIVARRRYLGNAVNGSRAPLVSRHTATIYTCTSSPNRKHRETQWNVTRVYLLWYVISVDGTLSAPDISLDQGCLYKNKTYAKGQTWMDGCDYRCTCERNDIVQCITP